jgi:hypothetical protein
LHWAAFLVDELLFMAQGMAKKAWADTSSTSESQFRKSDCQLEEEP